MAETTTPAAEAQGARHGTTRVTVRLFAGARAAAGTSQAAVEVETGGGVRAVLDALLHAHPGVARVLPACSYLLDGVATRATDPLVAGTCTLDVLPPFSGG